MPIARLLLGAAVVLSFSPNAFAEEPNWYERSFFLLHEDHHTQGTADVGADADRATVERLINASRPDSIQIHAKGNPGWTTHPTAIGYTPPKLRKDVLGLWRDVARANGYHWSIYYNIGRDNEIMIRRPEWNRSDVSGAEVERALCYHSGVAEDYILPMLDEIIDGYEPDGFWFDGSVFTIRSCYCDSCRERFQRERGVELPKKPGDPHWAAFQEMHRAIYREFVHETCRRIHAKSPECLVTFNWINSVRMPEKPDPGIAYLTGDIADRVEGLSLEAHWYDGVGLPFELMTTGHTFMKDASGRVQKVPKPAPHIEQEMAIVIANGGRFNLWDTPTPTSGLDEACHAMIAEVAAPFLRSRQPYCLGSKRLADVSLLHDAASHYALADKGVTPFSKSNNRIEGAADFLTRLHCDYDMVGDWRLAERDIQSPMLIVEHPKRLSRESIAAIETFVREGGDVLVTGMGVTQLRSLLGVRSFKGADGAEPLQATIDGRAFDFSHWLFRLKLEDGTQTLVETSDANGDSCPLLTSRRVGAGRAFYFATPLLTEHGAQTPSAEFVDAILKIVRPKSERLITSDSPEHVHLVLREQRGRRVLHIVNMAEGERIVGEKQGWRQPIAITSLPSVPPFQVSVAVPERPKRVVLQPEGREIGGWTYENGHVTLNTPPVDVHAMVVFERE